VIAALPMLKVDQYVEESREVPRRGLAGFLLEGTDTPSPNGG
jgi:hypothetical protein